MFCVNCGTPILEGQNFCRNCGQRREAPCRGRRASSAAAPYAAAPPPPPARGHGRRPLQLVRRGRRSLPVRLPPLRRRAQAVRPPPHSGWTKLPARKDMAKLQIGNSSCQIEGLYVPVADMNLAAGDSVYFTHHVLLWKDPQVNVTTMSLERRLEAHVRGACRSS